MVDVLARNWGWVALRGGAALLFGLVTLVVPDTSLDVLSYLFGAFVLAYGLFTIIATVANRRADPQGGTLLIGAVLGIGLGVFAFVQPSIAAPALHYFVASWCVLIGLVEIAAAIQVRREAREGWLLLMAGALSVGSGSCCSSSPAWTSVPQRGRARPGVVDRRVRDRLRPPDGPDRVPAAAKEPGEER